MTTHTPGPWKVGIDAQKWNSPASTHGTVDYVSPNGSVYRIGEVCYPTAPAGTYGHEERVANQHLIAAAPDLLEVVKRLHNFAVRQGWSHVYIRQADAAIAKAEGRS